MLKLDDIFVMHDGAMLTLDKLVSMAKQAGSYAIAEHYIVSIMYHALVTQQPQLAALCNDIRAYYHLKALPGGPPASPQNMPRPYTSDDMARQEYRQMKVKEQVQTLRKSLSLLWLRHRELFVNKECWMGIYMVVHDRLDQQLTKTGFNNVALTATPDEWPEDKRIGLSTMSNYARRIDSKLRDVPYYNMGRKNPWDQLCDRFWAILKEVLLTNG